MTRVVLLAVLLFAGPVRAQTCDPREAEQLRAHLENQAHRAWQWNLAWRISYTTAAVGALTLAITNPFPTMQDGFYVSAGKAAIAAAGRWILPLGVDVPASTGEPCADIAAMRASITKTAKQERSLFWLSHLGGIVVNGAGAVIIAARGGTAGQVVLSVAVGYPVGLLSIYTMPRASWHYWREHDWSVAYVPLIGDSAASRRTEGGLLTVTGTF